ncbi:hypothetical protein RFI_03724 [Reticulomyxa filosa]|uniref:Major facilitator superfamily (MFS) profile domain-containing protein n=1 Tax=Reticulomyxa filosa TaxID=46433 RepID=X6P5K4_RETFI|nr:hypothetical protein RFI_03724 [Reticulomyxa filosa]|eukprot:ETO33383.1 hypothetical protein RFI_03724 [Reticulomyxa filosa]
MESPFIHAKADTLTAKKVLSSWPLWKTTVTGLFIAFGYQFVDIVSPVLGDKYFGKNNDDGSCDTSGNATYSYWSGVGIFYARLHWLKNIYIVYFVQLMVSYYSKKKNNNNNNLIKGKLSDIYGRKNMLIISWFCIFMSSFPMTFTKNVWWFLIMIPVGEISGTFNGMPTVLQASFADVIPEDYRTFVYAVLYGIAGVVVIIASILTAVIQPIFHIRGVFIAYDIIFFVSFLWLIFVYEETLSVQMRLENKAKYAKEDELSLQGYILPNTTDTVISKIRNKWYSCWASFLHQLKKPLLPLLRIRENPIIFWISMLSIVVGLPESGISDILANYTNDLLHLCSTDEQTQFNAIGTVFLGLALLGSQLIVMPILTIKLRLHDLTLIFILLVVMLISGFSGVFLYFLPYKWMGYEIVVLFFFWFKTYPYLTAMYLVRFAFGLSFIAVPITSGAMSRRLDPNTQGVGFGVLHAVQGLTYCVAPYSLGALYKAFENYGWLKTAPYLAAVLLTCCGFPIAFGPLRRVLLEYDAKHVHKSVPLPEESETQSIAQVSQTFTQSQTEISFSEHP